MNNSMAHFSKYAISKKRTLNIVGGIDENGGGSYRCPTCSGNTQRECKYGCRTHHCQSNRIATKCAPKGTIG